MNKKDNTASFLRHKHCKDCGWKIIHACCNDEFQNFNGNKTYDYWVYCSNKGCKNHNGEDYSQFLPDWIESDFTMAAQADLVQLNGINLEDELMEMVKKAHHEKPWIDGYTREPIVIPVGALKNEKQIKAAQDAVRELVEKKRSI
jgi:hypothetical protein